MNSELSLVQPHHPIFILASPCAYASLLATALGQHSQAYALPNINLLGFNSVRQFWEATEGSRRYQRHGLLRLIAEIYSGEQTINAINAAKRWLFSRAGDPTMQIYHELLSRLAPLRVIDSSPQYITNAETLARIQLLFPDAFFIHIVRHPYSQGRAVLTTANGLYLSWSERLESMYDEHVTPAVLDVQYLWLYQQQVINQFLEALPAKQQIRVRAEDLLAAPENILTRIGQRLGWDYEAACLQPQTSPFACFGPANANLGYDCDFLAQPTFDHQTTVTALEPERRLPWRADGQGLSQDVIEMAKHFGYRKAKKGNAMAENPNEKDSMNSEVALAEVTKLLSDNVTLPEQHTSTSQELKTYRQELEYKISMLKAFYEEAEQELASLPNPEAELSNPETDGS